MRLLKLIGIVFVFFVFLATSALTGFGQETTKATTANTKATTANTACNQPKLPIRQLSKTALAKRGKRAKNSRKRLRRHTATAPPSRIIYLPAPTPKPPVLATSADYGDMVVNAGNEGKQVGKIKLASGNDAEDAGTYLNASTSPNLQAWFSGMELHVFSPYGGDGRIVITDKNGRTLDVISVSGERSATAMAMENNIADNAKSSATMRDMMSSLWWIVLIGLALIAVLLLLSYIRLNILKTIESTTYQIGSRLSRTNEMIKTIQTEVQKVRYNTDDISSGMEMILSHYGISRKGQPGPIQAPVIDVEAEVVNEPDGDPDQPVVAG